MTEPDVRKSRMSVVAIKSSQSNTNQTTASRKSMTGLDRSMSRLRVRRQSYGYSGVPGIKPVERVSLIGFEFKRPPLQFLNTYQLDPNPKFNIGDVQILVEQMLDESFTGHKYNPQASTSLSISLANDLMRKVKIMGFKRYRIIAVVTVGQKRAQSYNNALSFLWDNERDAYFNTQRECCTAFIQVTVLGIYLD